MPDMSGIRMSETIRSNSVDLIRSSASVTLGAVLDFKTFFPQENFEEFSY